jgi:6-pyruvoyltetrahydropterin/6-carboxytetrahydropterin synthase
VKVIGEPDPETGFVIDIKILKDTIRQHIIKRFDHKNLNLDTDAFKDKNPTAEHIAIVIWNMLRVKIDPKLELKVILYETERNFVEYPWA